jgi:ABC-type glycerol-3-phosphate transport system substrate-binding protein
MSDQSRSAELLKASLSRRQVLQGGLIAGSAAFIAACGGAQTTAAPSASAAATAAPSAAASATAAASAAASATAAASAAASATAAATAAPSASAAGGPAATPVVSYAGVTLHNHTGGYSIPAFEIGLKHWKEATGGNATFENIPFNEKAVKIAAMIATQDSSWDLQYTYDLFMQRFGSRLLLPLEGNYIHDTSDFLDVALKGFTTQSDQVLRGLPIHFSMWLWDWNATLFEKIGEDGDNPPRTYAELFALAPKFKEADIIPSVQPWLGEGGTFAAFYFKHIYNSTGHPMFSEDRTQVMFDGEEGLKTFQTIEDGLKSGWWDPNYLNITNEHDAFLLFGKGNVATVVHSETVLDPPVEGHRSGPFPGIDPGTTGSSPGADGLGVSKFSKQLEASWSFFNTLFSQPVAKEISMSETRYPPTRTSVIQDPEVVALQPLLPAYEAQSKGQVDLWSTPYAYEPVFDDVISKLIKGEYNAAQAHEQAVKQTQELIIKYLSA